MSAAAIPLVLESGAFIGGAAAEFAGGIVGEEIATSIGTAVSGAVVNTVGGAIESGAKSAVDSIFGEGSFQGLEDSVNNTYQELKLLSGDVIEIRKNIDNTGTINSGSISKLEKDTEVLNNGKIVKAVTGFAKDFSALASSDASVSDIIGVLSKTSPFYAYLISKFGDSLADFVVPTSKEYLKVAAVYNGQGLGRMIFENNEFSVTDETGFKKVWKYPEYNNYVVIPAIFGVYTGINSPNNALSLSGNIDGVFIESYLDKIAFLHDVGYHDLGSFNEFSDFQLISRAAYGKANNLFIFPNELAVANTTIAYFSTLGKLMRKMFGPPASISGILRVNKVPPIISEIFSDIYDINLKEEEIPMVMEQAVLAIKTSDPQLGQYGSVAVSTLNFELRNLLNNLEIELN